MYLNYNLLETFNLLLTSLKYDIFISILLTSIIMLVCLILNKDNKYIKYVIIAINIILISLILYYYLDSILTFKFTNIINNMYFYYLNSIIFLLIFTINIFINKNKIFNYIFYSLALIGVLFSLFMTHYLNNIEIIVIGNIFPMIKLGNIIYIIYYILTLLYLIKKRFIR